MYAIFHFFQLWPLQQFLEISIFFSEEILPNNLAIHNNMNHEQHFFFKLKYFLQKV